MEVLLQVFVVLVEGVTVAVRAKMAGVVEAREMVRESVFVEEVSFAKL